MPTKLSSTVVRETSVLVNDRPVIVSLTQDQQITLRLKGMKSGVITADISEVYNKLSGAKPVATKAKQHPVGDMNILHRLRSLNATTPSSKEALVKLDEILCELLKTNSLCAG